MTGRHWKILLQPSASTIDILTMQRVTLWAIGLLILSLIIMIIASSKRYKVHLDNAKRRFEVIFHASPDGILMLDDQLNLQLANSPVQSWSGLSGKRTGAGKKFFDLFTCQCPHLKKCSELSFLLCTSEQFEETLPEILETQIVSQTDGVVRTLRLNASRIQSRDDGIGGNGFICMLGDISTGKELERVKESYVATLTPRFENPASGPGDGPGNPVVRENRPD